MVFDLTSLTSLTSFICSPYLDKNMLLRHGDKDFYFRWNQRFIQYTGEIKESLTKYELEIVMVNYMMVGLIFFIMW